MIKNHVRRSWINKNITQIISWWFRGHRTKSRQDMGENDYLGSSINMSFWPKNTWWMIYNHDQRLLIDLKRCWHDFLNVSRSSDQVTSRFGQNLIIYLVDDPQISRERKNILTCGFLRLFRIIVLYILTQIYQNR